jgi:predicted acetyltransferase
MVWANAMIRPATEADLDRLVEIHMASYPDDRGVPARRMNFVQNSIGRLEDLRVVERDGQVVGQGFGFFDLATWFAGRAVPTLGIASIAVAPEARGTGVAGEILRGLEKEGRARGALLCILHAFRHGFYARRGYADVTPNIRLACDPRAIPSTWVKAARGEGLRTSDDAKAITKIYDEAGKRMTGWLLRPKRLWARRFANERRHWVVFESSGYVCFETTQREPHARTRLLVHEMVALDDEARRVLWGFLGMQAGQVAEIDVEIAQGDPTPLALTDIDGARHGTEDVEHTLGRVVAGPMIKMLHRGRSLAARGVAPKSLRGVTIDDRALASVAFGGLSLADAYALDLASGASSAIETADAALRIPPFFTLDRF